MKKTTLLLALFILTLLGACKKNVLNQNIGNIVQFSIDTLRFDTVFTEKGSITQSVKIINHSRRPVTLNHISLAGGAQSPFKLNINGNNTPTLHSQTIAGEDSLYVFVQVYIDPSDQKQPFMLRDSIEVQYNDRTQWLQLSAYGQNASYLNNKEISSDTTWTDDLPIVINGYVHVHQGVRLKIEQGAKIYLHATAPIMVEGTLEAEGTFQNPVIFSGDRIDAAYKDQPASWPGIYFEPSSKENVLRSVVIKNAVNGIVSEQTPPGSAPKITLARSVISNITDAGIRAVNSSMLIENSLVMNCGKNIELLGGGDYTLVNNTIVSYNNRYFSHESPVLTLSNASDDEDNTQFGDLKAQLINCIFWGQEGDVANEVVADKRGNGVFDVSMQNSIYRAEETLPFVTFDHSFPNEDPLFEEVDVRRGIFDFHLKPGSPAIKSGVATPFPLDLEEKSRTTPPDLGCYEME